MDLGNLSSLKSLAIQVGSVFRLKFFPQDGVKPKKPEDSYRTKMFVVIGIEDSNVLVGSVLINSQINDKLFSIIGPYQHNINKLSYSFLTKNESFIDCFQIKEISYDRIISEGEYVGIIDYEDIAAIKSLSISSPANKAATLKKFHLI